MLEIYPEDKEIVFSFIQSLISHANISSGLVLSHSEYKIFDEIKIEKLVIHKPNDNLSPLSKFDLILGDFPLWHKRPFADSPLVQHDKTVNRLNSLYFLAEGGYGIYSLEPRLVYGSRNNRLRLAIEESGCSIVGFIDPPSGLLCNYSRTTPIFLIVAKAPSEKEFIGSLREVKQSATLANSLFNRASGNSLYEGICLPTGGFLGFQKWASEQLIQQLASEYKTFTTHRLEDVSSEVNYCSTDDSYMLHDNSVYLHKQASALTVFTDIELKARKEKNSYMPAAGHFQIVCKPSFVAAEYLSIFFQSIIGHFLLKSLASDGNPSAISKAVLINAVLPIPDLKTQYEIVESLRKLELIKEKVSSFHKSLARNPISSKHVLAQIDKVLDAVGELADTDRIRSLIREGESKNVEFKETFSLDVRKQTKERDIRASSIKTIAAFLNSDGGVLLIGVNDAGAITGLDTEIEKFHKADNIHKSRDKFLLDFKNALKHQIGEQFYTFINHRFVNVDSQIVLFVECQASPMAVYVDNKDFFVRTNPSTDQLEGPKLVAYIQNHFKT
ncbi:RMtype1_S_Eco2747I-TRD2-CR2_like domain containing protein [Burkholderiaceae bacterium]